MTADLAAVPPVDWTWPAAELNTYLRAVFVEFRMSPDMTTAEPEWRNRALRAPDVWRETADLADGALQ